MQSRGEIRSGDCDSNNRSRMCLNIKENDTHVLHKVADNIEPCGDAGGSSSKIVSTPSGNYVQ